jgi:probable rRNA maturation factor
LTGDLDLSDVPEELRAGTAATLEAVGVTDGHLSVQLVSSERIRELNRTHRGVDEPTDVLSFPMDGTESVTGPRELGDVVICPQVAAEPREAAVHGVLQLCGYDHETDEGQMLELQEAVMRRLGAEQRWAIGEQPLP